MNISLAMRLLVDDTIITIMMMTCHSGNTLLMRMHYFTVLLRHLCCIHLLGAHFEANIQIWCVFLFMRATRGA